MERQAVERWLQPGLTKYSGSLLENTLGVGTSLGLVEVSSSQVSLTKELHLTSLEDLADAVHGILAKARTDDPDRIVLLTYAWFVVACERNQGSEWIHSHSNTQLADHIDGDLRQGESEREDRYFNSTKYAPWKDWVNFVGLADSFGAIDFYPTITGRLQRELRNLGRELGFALELEAKVVLNWLAESMPYLDGGKFFQIMTAKMNFPQQPRQLTWLLSNGLRDLHDLGRIRLDAPGDTASAYALYPDAHHPIRYVKTVTLREALHN